jgi:hypothetical protein
MPTQLAKVWTVTAVVIALMGGLLFAVIRGPNNDTAVAGPTIKPKAGPEHTLRIPPSEANRADGSRQGQLTSDGY